MTFSLMLLVQLSEILKKKNILCNNIFVCKAEENEVFLNWLKNVQKDLKDNETAIIITKKFDSNEKEKEEKLGKEGSFEESEEESIIRGIIIDVLKGKKYSEEDAAVENVSEKKEFEKGILQKKCNFLKDKIVESLRKKNCCNEEKNNHNNLLLSSDLFFAFLQIDGFREDFQVSCSEIDFMRGRKTAEEDGKHYELENSEEVLKVLRTPTDPKLQKPQKLTDSLYNNTGDFINISPNVYEGHGNAENITTSNFSSSFYNLSKSNASTNYYNKAATFQNSSSIFPIHIPLKNFIDKYYDSKKSTLFQSALYNSTLNKLILWLADYRLFLNELSLPTNKMINDINFMEPLENFSVNRRKELLRRFYYDLNDDAFNPYNI